MRILSFVTQKGGSGKSTIASSLAIAAAEAGERVFIIDMDQQASLTRWYSVRTDKANVAVEAVTKAKLESALKALEKSGVTLVIIDTPGSESAASEAAMKVADLSIIPARPNVFDLWASENTRKTLRGLRKEYAFLLNQCPPAQQSARVEQGAQALQAMGGLLTPLISARVDYQEASRNGLGVTELAPHSAAAEEMRTLWRNIKRRMARGKAKPAAAKSTSAKSTSTKPASSKKPLKKAA
ncbi:MAG: ParA family protein [Hyphomicrobiales bacterium]|nr:ParA family protein [Hyphomicrobiales bacterium]